jgi:hypothetical protein
MLSTAHKFYGSSVRARVSVPGPDYIDSLFRALVGYCSRSYTILEDSICEALTSMNTLLCSAISSTKTIAKVCILGRLTLHIFSRWPGKLGGGTDN